MENLYYCRHKFTYDHVYYISPDGEDANSGTQQNPFKTYEKAHEVATARDAIFFLSGNYTIKQMVNDTWVKATMSIKCDVFGVAGKVYLDLGSCNNMISFGTRNVNIHVYGLKMKFRTRGGHDYEKGLVVQSALSETFHNCFFDINNSCWAYGAWARSGKTIFENCVFNNSTSLNTIYYNQVTDFINCNNCIFNIVSSAATFTNCLTTKFTNAFIDEVDLNLKAQNRGVYAGEFAWDLVNSLALVNLLEYPVTYNPDDNIWHTL